MPEAEEETADASAPAKAVKAPEAAKATEATDTPEPKAVTAGGDE